MNDGMCKARQEFLGNQFTKDRLFDCIPEDEVPDTQQLKKDLLEQLSGGKQLSRKGLRLTAFRNHFCKFQTKDINAAIGELIKAGLLFSETGKSRINDAVELGTTAFDARHETESVE